MSQTQSNWKISWKYGERHRIVAVHPAPACGTASKAKEKKLVSWAKKGFEIPQPPRSAQKPVEVDGLEGLDKTGQRQPLLGSCVFVYNMMLCSVENPENSLFWLFPDMCDAMIEAEGFSISFHNCMHGGKRKKLTKWWSTKDVFAELQSLCDGKACKMEPCAAGISPVPDSGRGSVSAGGFWTCSERARH